MSNLKVYLDHCKKKLERNMHDIKMNSAIILKLSTLPVTKELIEETGIYKLIRNLSKREDEMGEKSLFVYKKWRKFYGDGVLTPTKEPIPHLSSKPPPNNIEPSRNIADPLSKCQNVSPFRKDFKHQSISKSDAKHQLTNPSKLESINTQLTAFKLDSKHQNFSNLISESKHQNLSKSDPKHQFSELESKHQHVSKSESKHRLSSPSKPESKHLQMSTSKPSSKHQLSSPSKPESKHHHMSLSKADSKHPMCKPDVKYQLSSVSKPEFKHFSSKLESKTHSSSESKQQLLPVPRPDPKHRHASPSKLEPKPAHHPFAKLESKHPHISATNPDFKHQLGSPKLDYKRYGLSPPASLASKVSPPKKGVRPSVNPNVPVPQRHEERLSSGHDFGKPPSHKELRQGSADNHHVHNQERKPHSLHTENHTSSGQDRRHKPLHPAFSSGGYTTFSHQRTADKSNKHHDSNSFDNSLREEKPASYFDANIECGLDVLDSLPGHQRNNEALIGQESRSSFGSENPEASLDITNGEKFDGVENPSAVDEDSNHTLGNSPAKRVFVEPYAIAMREGMFRVVKSKDKVPANILRLQQIYDHELMEARGKRSNPPRNNEDRNTKKTASNTCDGQTKSSEEGPSTPSKTKKPSSGSKDITPKPKLSSSQLPRPEAGQSGGNSKVKAPEEDRVRALKESRKLMKKGDLNDSALPLKMRKTSHHQ